jgi:hypothetical protein
LKPSKHIIVYTFQSVEDPLIKGLMLQYLLSLVKSTDYSFHLITHEQPEFKLSSEELKLRKQELEKNNIFWYPVNYHNGRFLVFKKIYDFVHSAYYCFKIKRKFKPNIIIGFLPLAAGFSAILAPILRLKLITYCFEPHSEYMADFKLWSRNSLKFALLRKYERTQIEVSKEIIVPTSHTKIFADKINPYSKKHVFPISIDTDKNVFNKEFREGFRKKNSLENKKVLLYMGKFGGLYYDIPFFIDFLYKFISFENYHILIISPDSLEIEKYIGNKKMDQTFFTILSFIPYDLIHNYISVADIGIVAVPPLPSQIYRTPVKTGLYLSCGIPYIINKGVAEDDIIASRENVGVVVNDFTIHDIKELTIKIDNLLTNENLAERCRNTAIKYRSHQKALEVLQQVLKDNYI